MGAETTSLKRVEVDSRAFSAELGKGSLAGALEQLQMIYESIPSEYQARAQLIAYDVEIFYDRQETDEERVLTAMQNAELEELEREFERQQFLLLKAKFEPDGKPARRKEQKLR